jgi:predicted P-loop ATPase/GTPase
MKRKLTESKLQLSEQDKIIKMIAYKLILDAVYNENLWDILSPNRNEIFKKTQMKEFKILTAHTASELNKQIESYIKDGWSIVGSHQVVVVHEQNRFAGSQHKDTIVEREYSISVKK